MPFSTHYLWFAVAALLVIACDDDASLENSGGQDRSVNDTFGGATDAGGGFDFAEPPELASRFLTPRAGRDFVFVPNELLDTVSKIDADSLEITSIPVGDRPTRLQAVEGLNLAVVLNQGSETLSVIRASEFSNIEDEVVNVPIDPRQNELILSPDGRYALAFFSFARLEDDDPVGNLQTISMVGTDPGSEQSFSLTVGFGVRNIIFEGDETQTTRAYIITDTGLSLLDFDMIAGDAVLPVIALTPFPLERPEDREVAITPSGLYAVTRDRSKAEVYIVRLSDGAITTLPLPGIASDLDLFPGQDKALVVVEEPNALWTFDVAGAFDDPSAIEEVPSGTEPKAFASISPGGEHILLFTPQAGSDRMTQVTLDGTGSANVTVYPLHKAICRISMAPDGEHAVVVHPRQVGVTEHDRERCELELAGDLSEAEMFAAEHPGYTLFDMSTGFARLVLSEVYPEDLVFWSGEDASYVYLTFLDEERGVQTVDRVNLRTLNVSPLNLGSPPSHLGRVLGRRRIWVNQEHPLGRMTFIDVFTEEAKTVTGFELNRFVR